MIRDSAPDDLPSLAISSEQVCYIIVKAREFEVKDEELESDPEAEPDSEKMTSVLDEGGNDPVEEELTVFIDGLNEDEQIDLVALTWLGRGNGSIEDWDDHHRQATDAHNERTAAYLLGIPLLPDYLDEAMAMFGRSCEDFELGRM